MADHDNLVGALRTLGRQLDVPPAPPASDVASAVRARLRSSPPARRRSSPPARRAPVLRYAIVIIILLVSGVIIAVPPVRAAVFGFFRIGGVEIQQGPGPALPATPTLPQQPVADLAEAQRLTGMRVAAPAQLGPPDEILVIERRVVSLIYRPTAGRPAIRLDVFDGRLDPLFEKFMRVDELRQVDVGGTVGWLAPGPHEVIYLDEDGRQRRESARLAAPTLIWQRDAITYRLEADLPADRLVAIAATIES